MANPGRGLTTVCLLLALLLASSSSLAASPPASDGLAQRSARWIAKVRERIHLPEKIARPLRLGLCRVRGTCTLMADRLEAGLPPPLARGFHRVRLLSPLTLSAFAGSKFKQDPLFLTGFGVASTVLQNLEVPGMIALGVNPGVAFLIHELIETPINLGVLCWRQHHLREDRSQSFLGTLRVLGRDYRTFAEKRQQENRRFMAERRAAASGSLSALGSGLP